MLWRDSSASVGEAVDQGAQDIQVERFAQEAVGSELLRFEQSVVWRRRDDQHWDGRKLGVVVPLPEEVPPLRPGQPQVQ